MSEKTKRRKRPRHYVHAYPHIGAVVAFFEDMYQPECANEVHLLPEEARRLAKRLIAKATEIEKAQP